MPVMKFRRLGKTNLRVSVVGIGTWQFCGEWGKDFQQPEVDQMFDACRQAGINLIDSAECYGDHTSETFVGNAISRDRQNWVIATKFGHKFDGYFKRQQLTKAADVQNQLEKSLKSLRTDYIDLLQYHTLPDAVLDDDELTAALAGLVKSGKVRHVGNSIGKQKDLTYQTDQSTRRGVEAIQVIYNRLDRTPEEKVLPSCIHQDLGVLARVPLAKGMLSGKYQPGVKFGDNDVRAKRSREEIDGQLTEAHKIQQTEVPPGVNMAQWALAWCLQHDAIACVIPGCKNVEQVRSNAAAAMLPMVREDHRLAWK
jgi:aryl-alcohol dehydrogenase-like predicted oxidoreductase